MITDCLGSMMGNRLPVGRLCDASSSMSSRVLHYSAEHEMLRLAKLTDLVERSRGAVDSQIDDIRGGKHRDFFRSGFVISLLPWSHSSWRPGLWSLSIRVYLRVRALLGGKGYPASAG